MKRTILILLTSIILIAVSCQSGNKSTADMFSMVPSKTAVILKANNLSELIGNLEENSFVKANPELPIIRFFASLGSAISGLPLSDRSLICYTKVGRKDIATSLITISSPDLLKAVGFSKLDGFKYNGQDIKTFKHNKRTVYAAKLGTFFVLGDSKLVIENMVRLADEKFKPNPQLKKLYEVSSGEGTLFIDATKFRELYSGTLPGAPSSFLSKFTGWVSLDVAAHEKKIQVSGVTLPNRRETLGLFKGLAPQKTKVAAITPITASGFYSFTFDKMGKLKKNLSFYRRKDYPEINTDLLASIREVGEIFMPQSTAVVMRSVAPDKTGNALLAMGKPIETYRGFHIRSFSRPDYFRKAFSPLIHKRGLAFYVQINGFFVFAQKRSLLENIIANVRSKTVLGPDEAYQNMAGQLSDKSSLLVVGISQNLIKKIAGSVAPEYKNDYLGTALSDYHIGALQFIDKADFCFVNGVFSESAIAADLRSGIQLLNINVGEDIAAGPWFFVNWRTGHYDIVAQGKSDTLYCYDEAGDLRWKRALDGRILGKIKPIDIYQNHRIQMAFVTPNRLYIVDRDGNIVKPFDKKFSKTITQPLALFDYTHNGMFRFVVTQGNTLTMFDKKLNVVKGFKFIKTKSPILFAPKHFRIGTKDYIIVAEKSGKLHILDRSGETRIMVSQNIAFSDNPWYVYQGQFTSTTAKGDLIQIDQNGTVHKTKRELGPAHQMEANAKNLVSFSENKLTINGKTVELDYGIYTAPEIFKTGKEPFVSITDTQGHKVYLFDRSAKLLAGFPVYGNSTIALKDMDHHGSLELLVRGNSNSILVYEVN